MKLSKLTKTALVIVLIAAWVLYAALNLLSTGPALLSAFARTPGSIPQKLNASAETANGSILGQSRLQEVVGTIRAQLGHRTINNLSLVRGEDGQLIYTNFYPYETYLGYDEYAQRLRQVSAAAQNQGASFLYLNCIDLYNEESNGFDGLPANNLNARSDAFLYYLSGYAVDHLDARTVLKNASLDPSEYLYKTEPHWTIQASFEVFKGLIDALKAQGSRIDPDGFYADSANYTHTPHERSYLGKLGKMAGASYSGYDDFLLILPDYETEFTISYSRTDGENYKRGSFTHTILDSHWAASDDAYENDLYCLYLSEVYSYRKITNHRNAQGPRILVVGDSYMLPVTAFLATAASEVHLLSPYNLPNDTESLIEYMAEHDFDHVIVGLNPGTLYDTGWNFLTNIDPTQTIAPAPVATASPSPAATTAPVVTPTAAPTLAAAATPTATATATPAIAPTATPSPAPAVTATGTATPYATITPVPVPQATTAATAATSATPAATIAPTPTIAPSAGPTPAATAAEALTPYATITPVPVPTAATLPTTAPTAAVTATPTPAPAATRTPIPAPATAPVVAPQATAAPSATADSGSLSEDASIGIVIVTEPALYVRASASYRSESLRTTFRGDRYNVVSTVNVDWYEVELQNGQTGFIDAPNVMFIDAEEIIKETGAVIVTEREADILIAPQAGTAALQTALAGEEYPFDAIVSGEWYEIQLENGALGFLSMENVSIAE